MLDYYNVYNDESNLYKKVIIKLEDSTLDLQNIIIQTAKLLLSVL